jgi:MoaA/NifB/PqqE/SkfB family radical SAM enzyme
MSIADYFIRIFTSIVGGLILYAIIYIIRHPEILYYFRMLKTLKKMGLREFIWRGTKDLFREVFPDAKKGDEILIIGRTLRYILQQDRLLIMRGLEAGINYKLLILDLDSVENNYVNLKPLQLSDADQIKYHLKNSYLSIKAICDEAKHGKLIGSFEVNTCDFLIYNSIVGLNQLNEQKRKILYDYSFGLDIESKFIQYFEYNSQPKYKDHFVNIMYQYYKGLYNQGNLYCRYENGKVIYNPKIIRKLIEIDVNGLVQGYSEQELIRMNQPKNLLSFTPKLFDSIKNNSLIDSPKSIQLELTNQCKTRCYHCRRYTWPEKEEMTTDTIKNLISELEIMRVQTLTFSGGEPTLRSDFLEILEYAFNKRFDIGILTNGQNIDMDLAKSLVEYSNWVRISLDGSNPEVYGRIRGLKEGFEKVKRSIENLGDAKKIANKENFKISICYSIQKLNINDIIGMIGLVNELNLSEKEGILTFKFVHGRNGFLCNNYELHNLYKNILSKEDQYWNKITNLKYLKNFIENYSNIGDIAEGVPLRTFFKNNPTRCFTPYLFSLIDAFGDVYPCCFLYYDNDEFEKFKEKREVYKMGNFPGKSFEEIWRGERYANLRKNLEIIGNFEPCQECTRHYLHNIFLTELFNKYNYYTDEIDNNAQKIFFNEIIKYPPVNLWL